MTQPVEVPQARRGKRPPAAATALDGDKVFCPFCGSIAEPMPERVFRCPDGCDITFRLRLREAS